MDGWSVNRRIECEMHCNMALDWPYVLVCCPTSSTHRARSYDTQIGVLATPGAKQSHIENLIWKNETISPTENKIE